MTKHITLISSQTTHHLNTSNFHGPLESSCHCHHHQKIYFTKRHHIWSNVPPTVDITKRYCMNNKKKIIKTVEKIKNAILHRLTHPTINCLRRKPVNTFLDFSTNIFHSATNFTKSLIKTF